MVSNRITVRLEDGLQKMIKDLRLRGYNISSIVRKATEKYIAEMLLDNSGNSKELERG